MNSVCRFGISQNGMSLTETLSLLPDAYLKKVEHFFMGRPMGYPIFGTSQMGYPGMSQKWDIPIFWDIPDIPFGMSRDIPNFWDIPFFEIFSIIVSYSRIPY